MLSGCCILAREGKRAGHYRAKRGMGPELIRDREGMQQASSQAPVANGIAVRAPNSRRMVRLGTRPRQDVGVNCAAFRARPGLGKGMIVIILVLVSSRPGFLHGPGDAQLEESL